MRTAKTVETGQTQGLLGRWGGGLELEAVSGGQPYNRVSWSICQMSG